MQLYTAVVSPNGKRVRIAADEAQVALEPVLLDVQKGEQRGAEYLAKNPMGKFPTMTEDGFDLRESAAIMCFIARKSDGDLWPREPKAEADTLRWLFFASCHLDPYFTTLVVERFVKRRRGEAEDRALTSSAEGWLARFLPVVDAQLESREFLTGRFGLGDIALGCTLELHRFVGLDFKAFPAIRAWLDRLHARDSWRRASVGSIY